MEVSALVQGASWLPEDRRSEARNIIEALGNLLYLIDQDAGNPALVRSYAAQAEERVGALQAILLESAPARPHNKGLKVVSIPSGVQSN